MVRRGVAEDWLLGLGPPPPTAAAAAALPSPSLFPSESNLQLLESMHWWATVTYHIVRNYFKGNHFFFFFSSPSGFNANLLMQFMEWEVTDTLIHSGSRISYAWNIQMYTAYRFNKYLKSPPFSLLIPLNYLLIPHYTLCLGFALKHIHHILYICFGVSGYIVSKVLF